MQRITFILLIGLSLSACTVGIVEQGVLTPDASPVPLEETPTPDATSTILPEETLAPGASIVPTSTPIPTETTPAPALATVDGWTGTIIKLPLGSQFDTYFERDDGERFGIQAMDVDPTVQRQIEDHRWTGTLVQVWGQLVSGIPDFEGRQVLVERIETVPRLEQESRNLAVFATASASSVFPSDRGGTYHAWSAIDGLLESPWVEGVSGPGVGEWIQLDFPGTIEVWHVNLDVGYDRDDDVFYANNRIKRATLIFSNGEQVTLDLGDTRGIQTVPLARAPGPSIQTTFVRMVIEEVYAGSQYDDTCLAEIEVWGITH
jgi:hypothetical protein